MPRKLSMFFTGLLIGLLVLLALMLVFIGVNGIIVVFTSTRPPSGEGLMGLLTRRVADGIIIIMMLALFGLAAVLGVWLPTKLWGRFREKPIPEHMLHRINPDA